MPPRSRPTSRRGSIDPELLVPMDKSVSEARALPVPFFPRTAFIAD